MHSINFNYLLTVKERRNALRKEAKESTAVELELSGGLMSNLQRLKTPPMLHVLRAANERRRRSTVDEQQRQQLVEEHEMSIKK
jgi:hypothetical protein